MLVVIKETLSLDYVMLSNVNFYFTFVIYLFYFNPLRIRCHKVIKCHQIRSKQSHFIEKFLYHTQK